MKYLLDTHTILWYFSADDTLSDSAKSIIINPKNEIFVSIATVWEVAIKISLRKLSFSGGAKKLVENISQNNIILQNLSPRHIVELEKLPLHHKDPFDRILTATAISENMKFVTCDENIRLYPVKCVW